MNEEILEYDLGETDFPKEGDIPIKQGGFCLYSKSDWSVRAWGFKRAADILADHILEFCSGGDLVIYPVVYLYRHYLELNLKDIITRGNYLVDEPIKLKSGHSLNDLWNDCRTILQQIGIPTDTPEVKPFEACIKQLDRVDYQSSAFRYPITRSGKPTLPTLNSVDLHDLKIIIGRMSFFLRIACDIVAEKSGETWGI